MDAGGSFLDFACVRVAVIPAGPTLSDQRFGELTSYVTWLREIPTSALPRRAGLPRASTNATYSSMPAAYREAWAAANESSLSRSRSSARDISRVQKRSTLLSLKPVSSKSVSNISSNDSSSANTIKLQSSTSTFASLVVSDTSREVGPSAGPNVSAPSPIPIGDESGLRSSLSIGRPCPLPRARTAPIVAKGNACELNLSCPDVDSCFRLRYEILHRDTFGKLLIRPPSEWDSFHSNKIWAVFAVADATKCRTKDERENAIGEARQDFVSTLEEFGDAVVKRLIVFMPQDDDQQRSFVEEEHLATEKDGDLPIFYTVGYVPEQSRMQEMRLEVRAHIYQCASTLLGAIDRECFQKRESPPADLILSPIDERHSIDRQSKLVKRRQGRLDKMHGDYLLLMGQPGEALLKYNYAMERAKANSDRLWLAGAMEGWSAAHVLLYVAAGGSLNDAMFCNRIIAHYADIYKLYQKKRVAEPEAAAALRLAEFLARWTNRRKEALDAAEHAATVGEGLRAQKRAALWEALARFSERMGCRRKAGLFLYRLAHLNASQSVWPSAVALMSAAEKQLSRQGSKPWPDLNRKLLLAAASHAIDAGDSTTAARLYAEALIISPLSQKNRRESDEAIVTALRKAHVPPFLPSIGSILTVTEIQALQVQDLVLRCKETQPPNRKTISTEGQRAGPFIYNPFEVRNERQRAAAAARRAVTWVRGETAQISVGLRNRIATNLIVDLIAVLMTNTKESKDDTSEGSVKKSISLSESSSKIWVDDEKSTTTHANEIRNLLDESKRIVKTKSETMTIPVTEDKTGTSKIIEVVPKQPGVFYLKGLLVRLFDGILVILRPFKGEQQEIEVTVIHRLPRISLTSYSTEGEATENLSSRKPLSVFHGERRTFRVDMKNAGPVKIRWLSANVRSSQPDTLRIIKHNFSGQSFLKGLENHGDHKSVLVEVLGRGLNPQETDSMSSREFHVQRTVPKISVHVEYEGEYEGETGKGMIRESRSSVRIRCQPAVVVRRVNLIKGLPTRNQRSLRCEQGSTIAAEVSNEVSAPATVTIYSALMFAGASAQKPRMNMDDILNEECFVESGASARLLCSVPSETLTAIRMKALTSSMNSNSEEQLSDSAVFVVKWSLPALGRKGDIPFTATDLGRLISFPREGVDLFWREPRLRSLPLLLPEQPEISIQIAREDNHMTGTYEFIEEHGRSPSVRQIQVGCFCTTKISIRSACSQQFLERCLLDLELKQLDDQSNTTGRLHKCSMIGAVRCISIGAFKHNGETFDHFIRMRIDSTGTFHLIAYLYEIDDINQASYVSNGKSGSSSNHGVFDTKKGDSRTKSKRMEITTSVNDNEDSVNGSVSNLNSANPGSLSRTPIYEAADAIKSSSTQPEGEPPAKAEERPHMLRIRENPLQSGKVVQPITIDTYFNTSSTNGIRSKLLATAAVEFTAERKTDSNYIAKLTPYFEAVHPQDQQPKVNEQAEIRQSTPDVIYQSDPEKH